MANQTPIVYSTTDNELERLRATDTLSVSGNTVSPAITVDQVGTGSILVLSTNGTPAWTFDSSGNAYGIAGTTGMSTGFVAIPAATGAPSGAPIVPAGRVPLYFDQAVNTLYAYNTTWKRVGGGEDNHEVFVISTNTTAVNHGTYILTASLALQLPSSPTVGDWVRFSNRSGTLTATVTRNGSLIMGLAEDMTLDSLNSRATLTYTGASQGWVITNE